MKKFMPQYDRILVELEPVKEKTVAEGKTLEGKDYKIVAPESHREKTRRGIVLAVGKAVRPEDEGRYSVGDTIMISFYVGKTILDYELGWTDDCHRVVRYDEVLGSFVG